MKNIVHLSFIAGALVILLSAAIQKSSGPPGCHANEPPGKQNCTSCHTDNPINSGTANILLNLGGADTSYIPGQTYDITVSINKKGMEAAGFQIIALQDNDNGITPGTITLMDAQRTQKVDSANPHVQGCGLMRRVWVEHTFKGILSDTGGISKWNFKWKAPDTYVGNITFFLSALESNYNGDETGDYVYTKSVTSKGKTTGINAMTASDNIIVFQDPAGPKLHVKVGINFIQKIELVDMRGMKVKEYNNLDAGSKTDILLDITGVKAGGYFLLIDDNGVRFYKKIIIQY